MGGCGGEYLALTISNLSNDYPSYSMDRLNQNDIHTNRWSFYDDPFFGFWGKLVKYSRNNDITFTDWGSIADVWCEFYKDKDLNIHIKSIEDHFDKYPRMLIRMHGPFKGFKELFTKSKHISITVETSEWYAYIKYLVLIKILGISYPDKDVALNFIRDSWSVANKVGAFKIIDKAIFMNRMNIILNSSDDLRAHSVIAFVDPWALGYRGSYEDIISKVLAKDPIEYNKFETLLATPEGIRTLAFSDDTIKPEFNIVEGVKVNTFLEEKYEQHKTIRPMFYAGDLEKIGIAELLYSDKLPILFNVDIDKYSKQMLIWHQRNMDMIYDLELDLNILLVNDLWEL